jgi:glycosyltransferase involved in cell wall biosynthesis
MKDGLVSVVIPTYEPQARFLSNALESVLGQSHRSLEAVVVHDGSDKVLEVIKRFSGHERIRANAERRRGYIAALNQGIEASRGDYIAFCDSDDVLNNDHVRLLADALKRFPGTGLAFDNLTYVVDSTDSSPTVLSARNELHNRPLISSSQARKFLETGVRLQDVFLDNLISGPAFMVPRRVFDRVGLFDEKSFLVNDLHLFYRIGAQFPFRYVDYMGVLKRVHAKNLTTTHPHYEYGVKSLENIRQHYPEVYDRLGKRVFNKKLARKYYRLGLFNECNGDRLKAKEMYQKAMLTRNFSLRYHWAYLRLALFQ